MRSISFITKLIFSITFAAIIGCSSPVSVDPITPIYPVIDSYPAWSPSGQYIVYYHAGIQNVHLDGGYTIDTDSLGLWITQPDNNNPVQLLNNIISMINWSRDGKWLVYVSNYNIYKAPFSEEGIDSLDIEQLTHDHININPTWSADDEWIYYDTNRADLGTYLYSIWKMKFDGTENQLVMRYGRQPHISQNGETLLYQMSAGPDGDRYPEIFSMDLNTKISVQLTHRKEYCRYPIMSPDCTKICFLSKGNLFVMNSNGSDQNILTKGGLACWSPQNDQLCFIGTHGFLWLINLDGSDLKQLTNGPIPE
ncbi:MAG: DUF5050 domain-containing protein [Bacteroidales bacterium]|nr:DUF5050 domain-containing protein [Candidatus Latescibacterota bacterium]